MGTESDDFRRSDVALDLSCYETSSDKLILSDMKLLHLETPADELALASETIKSKNLTDDVSADDTPNENFNQYKKDIGVTPHWKGLETKAVLEEDGDGAARDKEVSQEIACSRSAKKFMVDWDIEEVEDPDIRVAEDFQQRLSVKMTLASTPEVVGSNKLSIYAESKPILRAPLVLEQRLTTISELRNLHLECKKISLKNRFLNEKCCQYLKKIETLDHFENADGAFPIYNDQRYGEVLEEMVEVKDHYDKTKRSLEHETQNLMDTYYIFQTRFDKVFDSFVSRELEVGSQCIDGKFGKVTNTRKIQSLVKKQLQKFEKLADVRVQYISLHNRLKKYQQNLLAVNAIGACHSLMEFEQLTIIKHSLMDKLDEREEELEKLKAKCSQNISNLGHMKETCNVSVRDITDAVVALEKVKKTKKEERKSLAIKRFKKDLLRKDTSKIHSATGLLSSPRLLKKMKLESEALAVLRQKMGRSRRGT